MILPPPAETLRYDRDVGKRMALLSGVLAAAVVGSALFSAKELAVRYHQARMHRDPAWFIEGLTRPPETIVAEAARRVIAIGRYPGGFLVKNYLEGIADTVDVGSRLLGEQARYDEAVFHLDSIGNFCLLGRREGRTAGLEGEGLNAPPAVRTRLLAIQGFLAKERFTCADLPHYPGLEFSFHQGGDTVPEYPLSIFRPADSPYCSARRLEKRPKVWENSAADP